MQSRPINSRMTWRSLSGLFTSTLTISKSPATISDRCAKTLAPNGLFPPH
ncbi:hypothetical protein [Nostoc sp.]